MTESSGNLCEDSWELALHLGTGIEEQTPPHHPASPLSSWGLFLGVAGLAPLGHHASPLLHSPYHSGHVLGTDRSFLTCAHLGSHGLSSPRCGQVAGHLWGKKPRRGCGGRRPSPRILDEPGQ